MLLFYIIYKKFKRRGLQKTPEKNSDVTSLEYSGTQTTNRYNNSNVVYPMINSAQPNTRSTFVVADNSAYNYDTN